MKRFVKIALIVSAVLVVVGIAIVAVSLLMGGHISELRNSRMQIPAFFHSNNRATVTYNEYSKNNSYAVSSEGINTIQIDWISGEVVVKIGEMDQITFSESGTGLTEETALRYSVQGNTLDIQYCADRNFLNVNLPSKQLTLIVPSTLAANLRELSAGTVSANVTIDDPAFRIEELDFKTVSGNLDAVIASAETAELETVSGTLCVIGGINKFDAESVSGHILLDCRNGAPRELDVETVSGNVTLQLPTDADLTLEYETTSGDFDSALALGVHNGNYTIGTGRGEWEVETASGDLTVK